MDWFDFNFLCNLLFTNYALFFKKPLGLYTLLIGILFISIQFITSTTENFKSTSVFISFLVIITIVVKNSDIKKLNEFIKIITYCCLINLIYAFYTIIIGDVPFGLTYRIGGLDQAPVQFGYVMLLGFWLVLINPITQTGPNKSPTNLDKLLALAFVIGILLSKSAGALFGLLVGIISIIIFSSKANKFFKLSQLLWVILFLSIFLMTIIFFPSFYWEVLGIERYVGKFLSVKELILYQQTFSEARSVLWGNMLKVYLDELTFLKFFFGGGQGHGTELIGRGVHSDHLKLLFDHGVIGLSIYYFKVFSCLKLINRFNIFLIGFVASTLASGIFMLILDQLIILFVHIIDNCFI